MPTVKYVANPSPQDGTSAIKLGPDRFLRMNAEPMEISDKEFAQLNGQYKLEVVDEEGAPAPTEPVSSGDPVAAAPTPSRPVVFPAPSSTSPFDNTLDTPAEGS